MWLQTTDPLGSLALSALVAAIPIVVFLVALVGLRLSGILAGVIALVAQLLVAVLGFGMPLTAV
ncbi:MAG: L-lactate permease, partial [Microbacterium sp.]|nr:L-lactate permease [Microbacterium sp.]